MTVFPLDNNCQWIVHNNTRFRLDKRCLHKKEVSPTKVITTRSASAKTTPQQYRRKQAWQHTRPQQLQGRQQTRQATTTMRTHQSTRRTCALHNHWKAPTDDTHKTKLELCNTRASNNQHTSSWKEWSTHWGTCKVRKTTSSPGSNKEVNKEARKSNNSRRVQEEERKKHYTSEIYWRKQ